MAESKATPTPDADASTKKPSVSALTFLPRSTVPPLSPEQLALYLKRVGLSSILGASPSLALLRRIVRAHVLRIPFDNSHVFLLSTPVSLSSDHILADLVIAPRGGYCFQHNTLLASALLALDFSLYTGVGRGVVWDIAASGFLLAGPTHMTVIVSLPGSPHAWLADVGLPFPYIEPIPIADGALVPGPAGEANKICATAVHGLGDGFMVYHRRAAGSPPAPGADPASGFAPICFLTLHPCRPSDYEVFNFYSNYSPAHRSHRNLTLSRVSESGGHWTLVDRVFRQREVLAADCKCGSASKALPAEDVIVAHDASAFACKATETKVDIETPEQLVEMCWQYFGVALSPAELDSLRQKLFR